MPYIWVTPETREVNRIHYRPERLTEKQLQDGIQINTIPQAEEREGEYAVLCYDEERGPYYEYYLIPEPEEPVEEEPLDPALYSID